MSVEHEHLQIVSPKDEHALRLAAFYTSGTRSPSENDDPLNLIPKTAQLTFDDIGATAAYVMSMCGPEIYHDTPTCATISVEVIQGRNGRCAVFNPRLVDIIGGLPYPKQEAKPLAVIDSPAVEEFFERIPLYVRSAKPDVQLTSPIPSVMLEASQTANDRRILVQFGKNDGSKGICWGIVVKPRQVVTEVCGKTEIPADLKTIGGVLRIINASIARNPKLRFDTRNLLLFNRPYATL